MRHNYTTSTKQSTSYNTGADDLSSCMATGHSRKHRHGVRPVQGSAQDWSRASSMQDTCARTGSKRAAGARSAHWGTAR